MKKNQKDERKKLLKIILIFLDLTPSEIAKILNISLSVVSKHISGVKKYYPCDIFLIEKVFRIRIERYTKI